MSIEKFVNAIHEDDLNTINTMIISEWNPDYINVANGDVLMDIVERRPHEFVNLVHLLDVENLLYCIKFMNIDYEKLYTYMQLRGFAIGWIYNESILSQIRLKYYNHIYAIDMYEDCVEPSLLKILNYTFNHSVFGTFLKNHHKEIFTKS